MKSFSEILEAKRYETRSFDAVNHAADNAADVYAAKVYGEEAEKLMKNVPEIIEWCYLSNGGKEVKGFENLKNSGGEYINWERKNTTQNSYYGFGSSSQGTSGLCFTLKMKFPIKKELSFKAIVGDIPEYTFKVKMSFNTTGNKAYTTITDMQDKPVIRISDTTSMDLLVEKIKKLKPDEKEAMHEHFYKDWIASQDNHPLRGRYAGEKFGI
jgi:hypothetical protein